jgi:hypothetical protein
MVVEQVVPAGHVRPVHSHSSVSHEQVVATGHCGLSQTAMSGVSR